MRYFFDDRLIKLATLILVLIIGVSMFSILSDLPTTYPLLGVFTYSMVPILFIAGAVVFVIAILRS